MTYLNDVMDCNPLAFRDFFNTAGLLALQPKSFIPVLIIAANWFFLFFKPNVSANERELLALRAGVGSRLPYCVLWVLAFVPSSFAPSRVQTLVLFVEGPRMDFGLIRSMMSMIPRIVQSRTFHYRSVADFRVW